MPEKVLQSMHLDNIETFISTDYDYDYDMNGQLAFSLTPLHSRDYSSLPLQRN
jgi:hypothetical protein